MILFIKLLLAHLLGDFLLQPESWVKHRESRKLKSSRLYLHGAVHTVLTFLILWDLNLWHAALVIGISHITIDAAKALLQKRRTRRSWFFIDQALHLLVLIIMACIIQDISIDPGMIFSEKVLILTTAVFAVTFPSSIAIKTVISQWTPHTEQGFGDSLQQAGKYIGILERLFVLAFVVTGHWEAVGFLITAKSVFRFGDLRQSRDRKMTEYILIGTLLSFGIAAAAGLIVVHLI